MRLASTLPTRYQRIGIVVAVGSLLLTLEACGNSVTSQKVPLLWRPVVADSPLTPTPQAVASQTVAVETERLRPPSNKRIAVVLPDGSEVTAAITAYEPLPEKQFIWRGVIEGEPGGVVTFSVVDGAIVGDIITARGKMYTIRHVKPGVALVEELDPRKFPREEHTQPNESRMLPDRPVGLDVHSERPIAPPVPGIATDQTESIGNTLLSKETPVIDVMILYTSAVSTYANAASPVSGKINQMISDANASYVASKVNQSVRLVHSEQTEYTEKGDPYLDLQALKASSLVAPLSGLSEMRSNYNADIVVLLIEPATAANASSCGQASQMHDVQKSFCNSAFAVVPINCATSTYSFVHELGHVMGADHNEDAGTFGPPFDHSHGFIAESGSWHTIMAYPGGNCVTPECQRVLIWSSPDVEYAEVNAASGSESQPESAGSALANNALSLNKTAKTVAAFSDECD